MPFDEEDVVLPKKKIGVKLDNKNSILDTMPKKPSQGDFEKKAAEVNAQINNYTERALELSLKFKKVLEDKTLSVNKTPFAVDAERELIGSLVQLGIDMNLDEYEKEGMGSIGLIMLLLRTVLIQRDKINALDYNLNLLEKKLKESSSPPVDTQK